MAAHEIELMATALDLAIDHALREATIVRAHMNLQHVPSEYVIAGSCEDVWPGKVHVCVYSGRLVVDGYAAITCDVDGCDRPCTVVASIDGEQEGGTRCLCEVHALELVGVD